MAGKFALLIGNSQYRDRDLGGLRAPDVDVRAFEEVLRSPDICEFTNVRCLLNEGFAHVHREIARFYGGRGRDDLLLLYFSGHGIKDDAGHLYLAVHDTERAVLSGTAVPSSFIAGQMDACNSRSLVLMLDCCNSGAFAAGTKGAGQMVDTRAAFQGNGIGRVVLTATDSTQYAWEGNRVIGDEADKSLFTHFIVEGLRTGAADIDDDGYINVDELYDYVFDQIRQRTHKQTPSKCVYQAHGELLLAKNCSPGAAALPDLLAEDIGSRHAEVRFAAVPEIEKHLTHARRGAAAEEALERLMREDDSRKVVQAATAALDRHHARMLRDRGEPDQAAVRAAEEQRRAAAVAEARAVAEAAARAKAEQDEREGRRRDERIAASLARARTLLEKQQFEVALAELNAVSALDPHAPGLADVMARATAAKAAAEEQRRRFEERRRREQIDGAARRVEACLAADDLDLASDVLADARRELGSADELQSLQDEIGRHRSARADRERAVAALVSQLSWAVRLRRFNRARRLSTSLLALDPANAHAAELQIDIERLAAQHAKTLDAIRRVGTSRPAWAAAVIVLVAMPLVLFQTSTQQAPGEIAPGAIDRPADRPAITLQPPVAPAVEPVPSPSPTPSVSPAVVTPAPRPVIPQPVPAPAANPTPRVDIGRPVTQPAVVPAAPPTASTPEVRPNRPSPSPEPPRSVATDRPPVPDESPAPAPAPQPPPREPSEASENKEARDTSRSHRGRAMRSNHRALCL